MNVPLLDLKKQYQRIKDEIISVLEEISESQQFILGPRVEALEEQIAAYCDCKYAIGVSSGTDALLISLMAEGVGIGDLVITSPYTFFSTAGAVSRVGAIPVFVDIDAQTYNIDPNKIAERIKSLKGEQRSKLKAIIPVHLYGQCADMESIIAVAKEFDLTIIEDAAQAIGAEYQFKNGTVKRAGSMGQYGCFSFFPSKNLGAFGDGGIVTTNNEVLYKGLKILRVHGGNPKYYHKVIGGNFRLDALQAAIVTIKLKYLDEWTEKRIKNAHYYKKLFSEPDIKKIILPHEKEKRHIYNQFVIKIEGNRDALKAHLANNGIGCEIYYPVPLHMQECFKFLNYRRRSEMPVSEEAALKTLALPVYPELETKQIEYVVDMIIKFLSNT